jgi:hypothetical protein
MASLPDDKIDAKHIDDRERDSPSGSGVEVRTATRTLEAPEWIRDLSPEERIDIEGKLKRKIDLRLLPMVILMYIMNYLDRVRNLNALVHHTDY